MNRHEHDPLPLADDPNFLARLLELERGLDVPGDHPSRPNGPRALSAAPPAIVEEPEPGLEIAPAGDDLDLPLDLEFSERREPTGGRRPLLDLFPPPPIRDAAPPPIEIAPPPRLVRSRPARAPAPAHGIPTRTSATFYGFAEAPFSASSDLKFLYHSAAHDGAAQELLAAFREHRGIVVLTGEAGAGKTILCHAVAEVLGRRTLTAFVSDPVSSIEDLLRVVLVEFGVVSREDLARGHLMTATRQQLVSALANFVASLSVLDASAIVFVDNTQALASELLADISEVISTAGGSLHLQTVLVGEPSLLCRVEREELADLKDRIGVSVELRRLREDEIAGYVMHRIVVAGTGVRVEFDDSACAALAAYSGGVPGVVNQLCGEALALGQGAAASVIDDAFVRAGANRLGLTPPMTQAARWLRGALAAGLCVVLMLIGGSAAVWVFHDRVERTLESWTSVPPLPAPPPVAAQPAPLAPIAEPEYVEPPPLPDTQESASHAR